MKTIIKFLLVLAFLFTPSCLAKQENVLVPTLEITPTKTVSPTETVTPELRPTPTNWWKETLQPDTFGTVIDFVLYNAETKPDIDTGPLSAPRPLPILDKGSWTLKNRRGPKFKVEVIEKTDKFNTIQVSAGKKVYEIKISRGGIIFFLIVDPSWEEVFLFSPDTGEAGSPIDCGRDISKVFCYYPSSLVQIAVFKSGTVVKAIKETVGWCTDYENVPTSLHINEPATVDTYKLPNGEYYEWTKDNCPYSEITEITTINK